jgi:hypothetical protein
MTARKLKTGQGIGGGRPPLTPGEKRVALVVSVTQEQRDKVDRISDGKPSELMRNMIDAYPEPRK